MLRQSIMRAESAASYMMVQLWRESNQKMEPAEANLFCPAMRSIDPRFTTIRPIAVIAHWWIAALLQ
jgi:hypothetical protein